MMENRGVTFLNLGGRAVEIPESIPVPGDAPFSTVKEHRETRRRLWLQLGAVHWFLSLANYSFKRPETYDAAQGPIGFFSTSSQCSKQKSERTTEHVDGYCDLRFILFLRSLYGYFLISLIFVIFELTTFEFIILWLYHILLIIIWCIIICVTPRIRYDAKKFIPYALST